MSTLQELVRTLAALVDALQGAQALGGGATPTAASPATAIELPTQSPIQAGPPAKSAPVAGGGAIAVPGRATPAPAGYAGPDIEVLTSAYNGPKYEMQGDGTSVELFSRAPGVPTQARVGFAQAVTLPDSGSITLSTGSTVSWNTTARTNASGNETGVLALTFTPAGGTPVQVTEADDRDPSWEGSNLVNPLSGAELRELGSALLTRYPAAA